MKRLLIIAISLIPIYAIAEVPACAIKATIFKKVVAPQKFVYTCDADGVLKLIDDNIDTVVALPAGATLSARDQSALLAQLKQQLHDNLPLGDLHKPIIPDTLQMIVLRSSKGQVTGFINYFLFTDNTGYIELIVIAKTRRNRGYGRRLMNYALDELKKMGATIIELHTGQKNLVAQSLYKSLGFIVEGKTTDHDSLVLRYKVSK